MASIQLSLGLAQSGPVTILSPPLPPILQLSDGEFELTIDAGIATFTITAPVEYAGVYQLDVGQLDTGPAALVPPTVSGVGQVGQTLTLVPAIWAFDDDGGAPAVTRQWQADGVDIAGATGLTLLVDAQYLGQSITCRETATNSDGTRSASSDGITVVSSSLLDVTVAPVLLNDITDLGPVPGGRLMEQTSSNGGVFRFVTQELELGKTYRLTGDFVLDTPSTGGGRYSLAREINGTGGDLFNVLYRYTFVSGPNAIDETFTNNIATGVYYFGAFVRQDSGTGADVSLVDFSLQEI